MPVSWDDPSGPDTEPEGIPAVGDDYDRTERVAARSARYGAVLLAAAFIACIGVIVFVAYLGAVTGK